MPPFGAHMSVAGGLPRAVERAVVHRCDALQIFAKNANQWRGRPLPPEEIAAFRAACRQRRARRGRLSRQLPDQPRNDQRSAPARSHVDAMADELDRAEALGLLGVVLHPGCYTSGNAARRPRARSPTARWSCSTRAPAEGRWCCSSTPPARARRSARRFERTGRRSSAACTAIRASASASTRATCWRPATTSSPREGTRRRSTASTGSSASIA